MTGIIVPSRRVWTRQPQRSVDIDWSNPITRGLWFAHNPASGSYGQKSANTPSGEIGRKISEAGVNDLFSGSQTREFLNTSGAPLSGALSILVVGFRSSSSNVLPLITRQSGGQAGGLEITLYNLYGSPASRVYSTYHDGTSQRNFNAAYVNGVAASANGAPDTIIGKDYAIAVRADSIPAQSSGVNIKLGGTSFGGSYYLIGGVSLAAVWDRKLADAELKSLSSNPWQIFKPRTRRTIIDLGAGGTSSVYSDSALTYYIRSLLSADSGIQYAIRNAIYKDDAVGYYLRSAIAQNSEAGYVLRSAIAKDDAEAYKIRGLVQASDAEAYSIRGLVQTSDGEAYKIRGQVQADASASYDIQSSTSVASSNAVNYSVRGAVAASVLVGYSVRGSAQRDAASAYSVRSAVSRDVAASYTVSASVASVYADSTASYSVDGVVPSGPSAESIAAAVRSELAVEMARLLELAKINGLVPGVPSIVTETSRIAGDVAQTITEAGGAVTVSRA